MLTYSELRQAETQVQVEQSVAMVSTSSIESRVTRGLQMKEAGEKMIAQALREKKDAVGTEAWLAWCLEQWGWSRSTAYRHLDPKQMEAAREDTQARREVPIIGTGDEATDKLAELEQGEEADPQVATDQNTYRLMQDFLLAALKLSVCDATDPLVGLSEKDRILARQQLVEIRKLCKDILDRTKD